MKERSLWWRIWHALRNDDAWWLYVHPPYVILPPVVNELGATQLRDIKTVWSMGDATEGSDSGVIERVGRPRACPECRLLGRHRSDCSLENSLFPLRLTP